MTTTPKYIDNFLKWLPGRQATGYEKLLLMVNPFLVPFDCYLLRYKPGSEIREHVDPVSEKKHYRFNVVLKHAKSGGEFRCSKPIYETNRIKLFRPDIASHSVSKVENGTRYVLSIGWVKK